MINVEFFSNKSLHDLKTEINYVCDDFFLVPLNVSITFCNGEYVAAVVVKGCNDNE